MTRKIKRLKWVGLILLISGLVISVGVQGQNQDSTKTPIEKSKVDSNRIYYSGNGDMIIDEFEIMPTFPGGEAELLKFISKKLKYPNTGDAEVYGKVICRFIVNSDGSISNIKVIRSLEPKFNAEAVRVIQLLPHFIPAKKNGVPVRCWYTIPITFKIEK